MSGSNGTVDRSHHFGRNPAWLADNGHVAKLSGRAQRVLLILTNRNRSRGVIDVSRSQVAKALGCSHGTVSGGLNDLIRAGLVQRVEAGNRSTASKYILADADPNAHSPLCALDSERAQYAVRVSQERAQHAAERAQPAAECAQPADPLKIRGRYAGAEAEASSRSDAARATDAEPAAAGSDEGDPDRRRRAAAALDEVVIRGETVGEPMRSRLAALPHVTVELIRVDAAITRERGKGIGWFIRKVEQPPPTTANGTRNGARSVRTAAVQAFREASADEQAAAVAELPEHLRSHEHAEAFAGKRLLQQQEDRKP